MNARRAQLAMFALETVEHDHSVLSFAMAACRLEDTEANAHAVMDEECRRALSLADNYYARVSGGVTVMNPLGLIQIAFQQGITFAAAALGVTPDEIKEASP